MQANYFLLVERTFSVLQKSGRQTVEDIMKFSFFHIIFINDICFYQSYAIYVLCHAFAIANYICRVSYVTFAAALYHGLRQEMWLGEGCPLVVHHLYVPHILGLGALFLFYFSILSHNLGRSSGQHR